MTAAQAVCKSHMVDFRGLWKSSLPHLAGPYDCGAHWRKRTPPVDVGRQRDRAQRMRTTAPSGLNLLKRGIQAFQLHTGVG